MKWTENVCSWNTFYSITTDTIQESCRFGLNLLRSETSSGSTHMFSSILCPPNHKSMPIKYRSFYHHDHAILAWCPCRCVHSGGIIDCSGRVLVAPDVRIVSVVFLWIDELVLLMRVNLISSYNFYCKTIFP